MLQASLAVRNAKNGEIGILSPTMLDAKIALVGAYSNDNLGDVLLLKSAVSFLRRFASAEDIVVFCRAAPYLRALAPGVRLADPSLSSTARGELLVYGGGTQFFSFPLTRPTLRGRLKGTLASPRRVAAALLRRIRPTNRRFDRAACLGIGVGPFVDDPQQERLTRSLLGSCGYVAVRDPVSLELCAQWGLDHPMLGSDLCFLDDAVGELKASPRRTRSVGAIVRDWPHSREGAAYLDQLMASVERFRHEGIPVTFYSFCAQDDRRVIERLESLGHRILAWHPERDDIGEFLRAIAEHGAIVTTRYHGAVLEALLGRPCICVEIEPKLRVVGKTLGIEHLTWAQPFSPDALHALVHRALSDDYADATRVAAAVAEQRALAERMAARFAAFVAT
jgi:polysaccharide pyruvyl transferase WcaK-like protein